MSHCLVLITPLCQFHKEEIITHLMDDLLSPFPPTQLPFFLIHTHTCGEGLVISVLMGVLLRPSKPPHWAMLAVMVSLAFILSIVWLNIIANEVVGVLTALGLLLNIKTGQSSLM